MAYLFCAEVWLILWLLHCMLGRSSSRTSLYPVLMNCLKNKMHFTSCFTTLLGPIMYFLCLDLSYENSINGFVIKVMLCHCNSIGLSAVGVYLQKLVVRGRCTSATCCKCGSLNTSQIQCKYEFMSADIASQTGEIRKTLKIRNLRKAQHLDNIIHISN
jgi:hypothetical protein